ncbi:MAG: hypothetical protein QGH33_09660 [Pirellulaceae bacterium]|jgi:hypothetical protein|nr:hypothetical protein [Pirellulaceae bacterium]
MEQYSDSEILGSALIWLLSAACPGVISALLFLLVLRARHTGVWIGKRWGVYRRFTREEDPGTFQFGTTITMVIAGFMAGAGLLSLACSAYFVVVFLSR